MTPPISIVIPCFNHGAFLLEALASIAICDPELYEVVIVNDGSTDRETVTILENLSQQGFFVHHQENGGLSFARNQGIKLSQGKYILPLDCDNKVRPNYLEKSIPILEKYPEVGIVYGDVQYFGEKNLVWQLPEFNLCHLLVRNYIDACAVFRKKVWETCGGYDEQMPNKLGYEDWEFWLKAVEQGWQFYHLSEITYDYRVRGDSMVQVCKLPENQQKLIRYLCTKHYHLYTQYLPEVIAEKEFLLFTEIAQNESLQTEIDRLQKEILHLEKTIDWFQSSKFWKLRKTIVKLRQKIGRWKEYFPILGSIAKLP